VRIEPAPPGTEVAYARDGFVLGTMPPAFFTAVEETVQPPCLRAYMGGRSPTAG
jgi:hypothetical protein